MIDALPESDFSDGIEYLTDVYFHARDQEFDCLIDSLAAASIHVTAISADEWDSHIQQARKRRKKP